MHGLFENDQMFSAVERPWHGLGVITDHCLTSDEALHVAKLDWRVISSPIYTEGAVTAARMIGAASVPSPIPGFVANVREDTNEVLGVVSEKYLIAQNADAFKFADDIMGLDEASGGRYETAGSLFNGRKVFMLINLPAEKILDDSFEKYLCLSNAHDGSGALKVFTTGVRVVCNNTLNMALRGMVRGVSIRHMSSMAIRKSEALRTMGVSARYFNDIRKFAEELAGKHVDVDALLAKLYPEDASWSKRQRESNQGVRDEIMDIYRSKDDLGNHRNDAWGFVQAVMDFRSNAAPRRMTSTYAERKMNFFIEGDPVVAEAAKIAVAA